VPIAIAAAKAGKDAYVEKPLGVCIAEDIACRQAIQRYGRIFHEIVYALEEDEQIVGIFVDVTESTLNREKLTSLHREAIARSRDLLEHQVRMAQDITRLLAEHTARGEELVKSLIDAAVIDPHQAGAAESAAGAKRDDDPVR